MPSIDFVTAKAPLVTYPVHPAGPAKGDPVASSLRSLELSLAISGMIATWIGAPAKVLKFNNENRPRRHANQRRFGQRMFKANHFIGTWLCASRFALMRYVVQKGNKGWLVWDTTSGTCAEVSGTLLDDLSENIAKQFADRLNEKKPSNGSDTSTRH